MKRLILHIYDFLTGHRILAWGILLAVMGICAALALHLDYQEDITAFLPQDEQSRQYTDVYNRLGAQDRIAVIFQGEDAYEVQDAMATFQDVWEEQSDISLDRSAVIGGVWDYIRHNYPYFLTAEDYARADSLLAQPGYVRQRLEADYESLYTGGTALSTSYMRSDPLGLFSPVLQRLQRLNPLQEGATDNIIFFNSPYGGSESGKNALLKKDLEETADSVKAVFPSVRILTTGGPVVAVENASRIKKDSILAVSIALILILLVLWLSFKRLSDVVWIVLSILCGAVFSLGIIAAFKSSVSIIILGIGSMIIGIAVNYPLHFADHLKFQKDKRRTLSDQVNPLLIGNITTVGAFASLMLLKAEALHDFGFIGAMMLVGTILFVLIFLPVFLPAAKKERKTLRLDFDRHITLSGSVRRAGFVLFLLLTGVLWWFGREIRFDSDLHHINYMTAEQEEGFALLSDLGGTDGQNIYLVAEGATADEAIEKAALLTRGTDARSILPFFPSEQMQKERLEARRAFIGRHPALADEVEQTAGRIGFAPDAFGEFTEGLRKEWPVQEASYFEPVTATVGQAMVLPGDGKVQIVSYASTKPQTLPEGCFAFGPEDVSNSLVGLLNQDFDKIGLLCSLIVFFFLWLSFGSLELSITSFLPLAVGWIWILGIMRLTGLQFNIVNIILATFIFGQGDDYTIFITEGLMYEYATGKKILSSYKNCVVLSALIMFIGIGALITARHPAMRSLAEVTIIGMVTVVLMAYYLPPLVFRWLTRDRKGDLRSAPLTLKRLLYTALTWTVAIVSMFLFTLVASLYFLLVPKGEKRNLLYHKTICGISRFAMRIIPGARFTVNNTRGEDFSRPAVYICNHQAHMDALAVLSLTPKMILLTNDWVWNNPFYGYLIRKAEFHPISDGFEKNLPALKDLIARGYSIAIFPEGTRSADCRIQRFYRGAFLLSKAAGIPVIPLCIHGFGYVLPKEEFVLREAGMYLEIGERIAPEEMDDNMLVTTKAFRHRYIEEYNRIRLEREKAAAIAPMVRYQYLYKGEDASRERRKYLNKKTFKEIDGYSGGNTLLVRNSGCGVWTLLFALAHRDITVYATEEDEDKRLTAVRCRCIPENLHYLSPDEPVPDTAEIITL